MFHRRHMMAQLWMLTTLAWLAGPEAVAQMQDVTIDFYPHDDASEGHPIRLLLEAEFFPQGRPFEQQSAEDSAPPLPAGSVERFLADYAAVLRDGSVERALPFWLETEREEARRTLSPVFEQQRGLFEQVTESRLYTTVRYGRYVLAAVRHERADAAAVVAIYPLVESEGGWALTNALQADPLFQLLFIMFHEGRGFDRPLGVQP